MTWKRKGKYTEKEIKENLFGFLISYKQNVNAKEGDTMLPISMGLMTHPQTERRQVSVGESENHTN